MNPASTGPVAVPPANVPIPPTSGVSADRPSGHWPGLIATALTATVAVMPGFTVGALATSIEADLNISRSALGLAMSAFYAATALGSPFAKRLAARLPVPASLTIAALTAAAVMTVAAQIHTLTALTALLVAGGLANGLVQPAAGRLIAARAPAHRRSLAAGLVGAALGAATLLPGVLVAFVEPEYGWRASMLVAGLIALLPIVLAPLAKAPPTPPDSPTAVGDNRSSSPATTGRVLVLWALAAALSATGNNAVATYFVQLGDHAGLPALLTGNLLSLSAVLAIAVRLTAGALTDLAPRHNPTVITAMMAAGALGLVLIATGSPVLFVAGAVLSFSAGWGWTGLLLATTLRLVPGRTENAGHTVQVGIYSGATVAPFAFGALSSTLGFTGTALIAALAAMAAAVAMAAGTLTLRRQRTGTP
ncbi:MFS transporter [Nonomuraea purpurea]|uniref:MFS transporter n=1 Tax=Nonomuraea purpurea TaxID=1849276 RepID=A0ABV8GP76_9ACTN